MPQNIYSVNIKNIKFIGSEKEENNLFENLNELHININMLNKIHFNANFVQKLTLV